MNVFDEMTEIFQYLKWLFEDSESKEEAAFLFVLTLHLEDWSPLFCLSVFRNPTFRTVLLATWQYTQLIDTALQVAYMSDEFSHNEIIDFEKELAYGF